MINKKEKTTLAGSEITSQSEEKKQAEERSPAEEKKQAEKKSLGILGSGVAVKQVRDTGKRRRS